MTQKDYTVDLTVTLTIGVSAESEEAAREIAYNRGEFDLISPLERKGEIETGGVDSVFIYQPGESV